MVNELVCDDKKDIEDNLRYDEISYESGESTLIDVIGESGEWPRTY